MLRAKRMTPATRVSHSRLSSCALPCSVVPWKPTSKSSPSRGLSTPKRSGVTLRQPATRTTSATPRRSRREILATTDGVDQPPHAGGVNGLGDVAAELERRAAAQRVGDREQLGRRLCRSEEHTSELQSLR